MPTILVCDDSAFMRNRIKGILAPLQAEICEAVNGKQCVEILCNKIIDILIVDLLMPELSGEQVLAELQRLKIGTPAIVVSADIQSATKAECMALGAKGFFNKPPQPESLLQLVNELLAGKN